MSWWYTAVKYYVFPGISITVFVARIRERERERVVVYICIQKNQNFDTQKKDRGIAKRI